MKAAVRYVSVALLILGCVAGARAEERAVNPQEEAAPRGRPRREDVEEAKDQLEIDLPDNVAVARDVIYGKGGERELKLTLFAPKYNPEVHPGIVFVHGGAWRKGSPALYFRHAVDMASKGYVCAAVEYRLSGEAAFPAAVEDVKCAVRSMRANARTYRLDPEKIAAVGNSAGGHLAAMLGVMNEEDDLEGTGGNEEQSSKVNAVVAFYGVHDFMRLGVKNPEGAIALFLGGLPEEVPEVYKRASPITYVDESDAPFLLLHGTADKLVPIKQSEDMRKALEEAGVRAELYVAEGGGHVFEKDPAEYDKTLARMEEFLADVFDLAKPEEPETPDATTKATEKRPVRTQPE